MTAVSLLSVRDLGVTFRTALGPVRAVRGLNFEVAEGETLAIVGESGSGKSVTGLSIMRLVEKEGGLLQGALDFTRRTGRRIDLATADQVTLRQIRGNEISMIFQEPMTSLNPVLTVGTQIAEVLRLHRGMGRDAATAEARRLLERVRLSDPARRTGQFPHELSGGMRQRVMIAMALACQPRLLIADEPTTALDVTVQAEILNLIKALQAEIGMALVFITHDMGVVAETADRVLVMRHGEKVEEAGVGPIFARPGHPYTRELLAAVPRLGDEAKDLAPARPGTVLEVEGLTKRFPLREGPFKRTVAMVHAVDDVTFKLAPGETLGLVGESGCGKSTTGRSLMRLVEPTSGTIRVLGQDVLALNGDALRAARRNIQMVFQDPYASLNPRLSILASITEPLEIHKRDLSAPQRRDIAAHLMERVGLSADYLSRYPHQFSGGQRQRIAIARALTLDPKVIIADEPVSALDASIRAQVLTLFRHLQRELGLSYVFISHDMAVVEQMSHRVAVMRRGRIVEIGPSRDVLGRPRHPYTRMLLESVPVVDPLRRRKAIAPMNCDPGSGQGIPEHPVPPLRQVGADHFARVDLASI